MTDTVNTPSPECGPELDPGKPFTALMRPVLLVTLVFFFNFLARLILAPFLVSIEQDLSISHMQSGGLFLYTSLGISLALVSSGFLARKVQHRRTILLSSFGVGMFMILISRTSTLEELRWAMFGLGMAVGLYLPSGISTITSVLPRAHWGKGLAVHELAPNLSFISAPAIAALTQGLTLSRRGSPAGGFERDPQKVPVLDSGLAFRAGRGGDVRVLLHAPFVHGQ
jgi:NNP family nitrate/nitrite transporter-like MFS transporter